MFATSFVAMQARQISISDLRQPGDLGVLRRVTEGAAREAKTRGFASLPFGRSAFDDVYMGSWSLE
jgi:hypothetical protein